MSELKRYVVKRDGQRDLSFEGEKLNWVTTNTWNSSRWTECSLYKTKGGKYVIEKCHYTLWQGEFNTYHGYVGNTLSEVFRKAFDLEEPSDIAKELADGFYDFSEHID